MFIKDIYAVGSEGVVVKDVHTVCCKDVCVTTVWDIYKACTKRLDVKDTPKAFFKCVLRASG